VTERLCGDATIDLNSDLNNDLGEGFGIWSLGLWRTATRSQPSTLTLLLHVTPSTIHRERVQDRGSTVSQALRGWTDAHPRSASDRFLCTSQRLGHQVGSPLDRPAVIFTLIHPERIFLIDCFGVGQFGYRPRANIHDRQVHKDRLALGREEIVIDYRILHVA
jgi:hypothetical protein